MKRLLAISDIHGELNKFEELLKTVNYDQDQDQLILVGDYIDRGPNSKGVLNKVQDLVSGGAIALRGNHDQMMLDAYQGKEKAWKRWIRNGGLATLESYDPETDGESLPETEDFKRHIHFIDSLPYYWEIDDYLFVHAGIEPGKTAEETDPHELIWIREKFHQGYQGDKTVIFGHTPTPYLHDEKDNYNVYFGQNNIIGIDGAAVYGGQLNCLIIGNNEKKYNIKSI